MHVLLSCAETTVFNVMVKFACILNTSVPLLYAMFLLKASLPARASEQGNVIGLVSVYIYMYVRTYVVVIKKKL